MMSFENFSKEETKEKKESNLDSLLEEMKSIIDGWQYVGSEEGKEDLTIDEPTLHRREQAVAEAFSKIEEIPEERKEEIEAVAREFFQWADDERVINKIREKLNLPPIKGLPNI